VSELPSQSAGHVTFACLNNPGKSSPTALSLWAGVLQAVPASRLLLLTSPHTQRVAEINTFFQVSGVDPMRIEQVARAPLSEYLSTYCRVDIALDSWPYSGGTTTCDALWMGVPVITLAGDRSFSRSGASILTNLGLPELVAQSNDSYVRAAIALASDRGHLRKLRETLRARMQASPLMDAPRFARDFEAALASMLERTLSLTPEARPDEQQ
jgi:predicted O-linked N-acetylglucosamine transferase (SPINDLY family)